MSNKLKKAAEVVVNKCLALKPFESCLVISDKEKLNIANLIFDEAKKVTSRTELLVTPSLKINGEEPPLAAANKMLEYDVIIVTTSKSISHTKARRDAIRNGARLASMPGITEDMMARTIDVDYDEMQRMTANICQILDKGSIVRISTSKGTDISMDIRGRKSMGEHAGIFDKPGIWGNLPEAESCLAPVEATTNGVYIVDGSQAGVGLVKIPIRITVKDGLATKIEGGEEAKRLQEMLNSLNDKNAYNVAELGIGTNIKAKITGLVLEDEKVYGTCHIALGNNISYGGNVDVPIHVDGVIQFPTIEVDGKIIMKDGKLLI